jgi:hypothetical protein
MGDVGRWGGVSSDGFETAAARIGEPTVPSLLDANAQADGERPFYRASRHVRPETMLSMVVRDTLCLLASQARDVPGTLISLRMSMT